MYVQWLLLLIQLLAGCRCCFYLSPCIVLHRYLSTCITAKLSNSPSIKLFSCVANIASEIHFLYQCFSINIIVNISAATLFRRTLQIMSSKHFCSAVQHIIQITGFCECATLKGFFIKFNINCDLLAKGQKHHWLLLAWLCNPGYKAMAIA